MLNAGYIIRKMTPQDLDTVMIIEYEAFAMPWSRESYLGELKNSFAHYIVADCAGKVAGYLGLWVVFDEAHITNVAVADDYRRQGLGKALMLEAEKYARSKKSSRIMLEVRPSNTAALDMYKNLNYLPGGERKNYYSNDGEDAIIMIKLLF